MPSGKWLTPNEGATEFFCRLLRIPLDDRLQLLAAVNGALLELTHEWNWEDYGTMSAEDTAELMNEIYAEYAQGSCAEDCVCTIPPEYGIDIGIELKVIRINTEGHPQELVGGEWVEPTGAYEIPAIAAREESTAEERRCLAAANAAAALEQFYEDATDAYQTLGTPAAVVDALLGAIVLIMGAFGQATAASNIAFGQNIFSTFFDIFGLITGDVWTDNFTDEFSCILYNNSVDTAGVVTFDYEAIKQNLYDMTFQSGGDLDRQLLIQQLHYLLFITGIDGVNIAGTTTSISTYDCDECGDFCYLFDFATSNGGFAVVSGTGGFYDTTLTPDRWRAAQNWSGLPNRIGLRASRTISPRFITRIEIDHELDKIIGGFGDAGTILLLNGGLIVWQSDSTIANCGTFARRTDVYYPNVIADTIRFGTDVHTNGQTDGCSGASGQYYCYDILIAGEGSNPIGADNC